MAWFITLEGGDGVGKSTLLRSIEEDFKSRNIPYLLTREPGGTDLGEEIRKLLLQPGRPIKPLTELFLFEAARSEHVNEIIRPALVSGKHVLCDRFTHSSLAFQGVARRLGLELVSQLNHIATGGLSPDLVLWLKLDPKLAISRSQSRGNETRLDQEEIQFHHAVFQAFEKMAYPDPGSTQESPPFLVLDASLPAEKVFEQLQNHSRWKELFEKP